MKRLHPRHRLDVSVADLAVGLVAALRPGRAERLAERVAMQWAPSGDGITCLSVRSALDLLLTALGLPARDEVLISAITHPDMVRVIRLHGLVPVPVDVDPDTLGPVPRAMEAAMTGRSTAILVAHLFGARVDLDAAVELSRRHDLLLIEDCAQSIRGPTDSGDPWAHVSLFSFGTIKTATALGGALVRVSDVALLPRCARCSRLGRCSRGGSTPGRSSSALPSS